MAKRRGVFIWDNISLKLDCGRIISAAYGYSARFVTVQSSHGRKIAEVGTSEPKVLALKLLIELINEKTTQSARDEPLRQRRRAFGEAREGRPY
jgi:hypothetical protein